MTSTGPTPIANTATGDLIRQLAIPTDDEVDAINNARRTRTRASELKAWCEQRSADHQAYVVEHLEDMPEVRDWVTRRLGRDRLTGGRDIGRAKGVGRDAVTCHT